MGRRRTEKRKQRQQTDSKSGSSTSDTSALKSSDIEPKSAAKKPKISTSTPISHLKETLSQFEFRPRGEEEENMTDRGENSRPQDCDESHSVFSPDRGSSPHVPVSNADLMSKLCKNGAEISKLSEMVEELRAALFTMQTENDKLKQEVTEARQREELMRDQLTEARHLAELADRRVEDLSAYIRRNNIRIYGLKEQGNGTGETSQQSEEKVLSLFNNKLKVKVTREDIEAVHRVGQRRPVDSSSAKNRGIIVRFVSRRVRDSVLYARKVLKGSSVVLVEDLTPRAYSLLNTVKNDSSVCQQAWTKNGNVIMKAVSGQIVTIKSVADLNQTEQRSQWSKQNNLRH